MAPVEKTQLRSKNQNKQIEAKQPSDTISFIFNTLGIIITAILAGVSALFALNFLNPSDSPFSQFGWDVLAISGGFSLVILFAMGCIAQISKSPNYPQIPSHEDIKKNFVLHGELSHPSVYHYENILEKEFEYTSSTAEQAMEHRMTIVNFYILIVGGAGSAIVALLSTSTSNRILLEVGAIGLLWIVSIVGWFSTMKLVRIRMAWAESAANMNYIKIFFAYNAFDPDIAKNVLDKTLYFKPSSVPAPYKRWNVFFYSVLMVAVLDSGAFLGGSMLLSLHLNASGYTFIPIGILSLLYFISHVWIYDISLKPKPKKETN